MALARPLAVLRIAKIKTAASLARRSGHVARSQPVENADPFGRVVWLTPDHDPSDAVHRTIAGLDRPPRKNAVLAVEVVMTASPSAFIKADSPAAFADLAMAWVEQTFGPGRVCTACLHLDERTPHIHAFVVPWVDTPVAKRGRKPKDGKPRDPMPCRRLDCASLIGRSRADLSRLQDTYAAALAPLGIERGKKRLNVRHTEVAVWKAQQAAAERAAQAAANYAQHAAQSAYEQEKAATVARAAAVKSRQMADAWSAGVEAWAAGELVAVSQERRPVFAASVPATRRAKIARTVAPIWPGLAAWIEAATARVQAVLDKAEATAAAVIAAAARISPQIEASARRQIAAARPLHHRGQERARD